MAKDTTVLELFVYNDDGTRSTHRRYIRVPNNFLIHKQERQIFGDGYRTITTLTEEGWDWLENIENMASKGNRNWLRIKELSDEEVVEKAQQTAKKIEWLNQELENLCD